MDPIGSLVISDLCYQVKNFSATSSMTVFLKIGIDLEGLVTLRLCSFLLQVPGTVKMMNLDTSCFQS